MSRIGYLLMSELLMVRVQQAEADLNGLLRATGKGLCTEYGRRRVNFVNK